MKYKKRLRRGLDIKDSSKDFVALFCLLLPIKTPKSEKLCKDLNLLARPFHFKAPRFTFRSLCLKIQTERNCDGET